MPIGVEGNVDPWNASNLDLGVRSAQTNATSATQTSPWNGQDTASASQVGRHLNNLIAGRPFLSPPRDASQLSSSNSNNAVTAQPLLAGRTPGESDPADQTASSLDVQFTHDVASLVNEGLRAAGYAGSELTEQTRLVNFYLANPDAEVPPEDEALLKMISEAKEQAEKNIRQNNPGVTWSPPEDSSDAFNAIYEKALNNALAQLQKTSKPPLTKAQVDELRFAMLHPDLVSSRTLQSANMLKLQQSVPTYLAHAGPGYALPAGWKPDSSGFDAKAAMQFNSNFELELAKYATENDLTPAQENALRAMHYAPDLQPQDAATLTPILTQLETAALSTTNKKLHVPAEVSATWRPSQPDESSSFENRLLLDYQHNNETNLQQAIQSAQPPLTAAQQQQLRGLIADPSQTEGVSEDIVKMAQDITQQSVSETNANFDLEADSWTPPVGASGVWSGSATAKSVLDTIDQMQAVIKNVADQIPDGPAKQSLLDLLGIISSALAALQQSVYAMETEKSKSQKEQQLGIKDSMDAQIAIRAKLITEMKDQMSDMYAKQAKANKMSGIMKIVGPIVIALSVLAAIASFGTMSGLAIAVTVIMLGIMIHDQVDPAHSVMGAFTAKIAEGLVDAGMSEKDAAIVAAVIVVVIVLVVMGGANSIGGGAEAAGSSSGAAVDGATTAADGASSVNVAAQQGSTAGVADAGVGSLDDAASVADDVGSAADDVGAAADDAGSAADAPDAPADAPDAPADSPEGQVEGHKAEGEVDQPEPDEQQIEGQTPEGEGANKQQLEAEIRQQDAEIRDAQNQRVSKEDADVKELQKEADAKKDLKEVQEGGGDKNALKNKMVKIGKMLKIGSASLNVAQSGIGIQAAVINLQIAQIQGVIWGLKSYSEAIDTKFDDSIESQMHMIDKLLKIMDALTKWNASISSSEAKMWQDMRQGQWV